MLQRIIDDLKDSTGSALRLWMLAIVAAAALLITTSFLCAAAFIIVLQHYGLIQACLSGAAVFLGVTLIAAGSYLLRKRQLGIRAAAAAKSTAHRAHVDPVLVAAGVQMVRAIGIRKLIPILAVCALGWWQTVAITRSPRSSGNAVVAPTQLHNFRQYLVNGSLQGCAPTRELSAFAFPPVNRCRRHSRVGPLCGPCRPPQVRFPV
jgi:hypothetical protein